MQAHLIAWSNGRDPNPIGSGGKTLSRVLAAPGFGMKRISCAGAWKPFTTMSPNPWGFRRLHRPKRREAPCFLRGLGQELLVLFPRNLRALQKMNCTEYCHKSN
jgi:hypothetical protein